MWPTRFIHNSDNKPQVDWNFGKFDSRAAAPWPPASTGEFFVWKYIAKAFENFESWLLWLFGGLVLKYWISKTFFAVCTLFCLRTLSQNPSFISITFFTIISVHCPKPERSRAFQLVDYKTACKKVVGEHIGKGTKVICRRRGAHDRHQIDWENIN